MIHQTFHRWLGWLLIAVALLISPAAISADDPDEFIQQWQIDQKWQGDFDGMVERRRIRVLVAYNKLFFFFRPGAHQGREL